jgi:hypothetical protein
MYCVHRSGLNTLSQTACHIPEDCNLVSVIMCEKFGCYFLHIMKFSLLNFIISLLLIYIPLIKFTWWDGFPKDSLQGQGILQDWILDWSMIFAFRIWGHDRSHREEMWDLIICRSDWSCDKVLSVRVVPMFGKNILLSYSSVLYTWTKFFFEFVTILPNCVLLYPPKQPS